MGDRRDRTDEQTAAVLIPVKAFSAAKERLADALGPDERRALAERMADQVVAAAHDLPAHVVCDDEEVAEWATGVAAAVIWSPGKGLNGAVQDGVAHLAVDGVDRVIVAHADLPHARDLRWVADFDGITLVPDRHADGTNVMCIPSATGFRFAYGPGSFERHRVESVRLGIEVRVVDDERLGWDVDVPADLATPEFIGG